MPRGGTRTGAGRKKGFAAKSAEEARQILAEMVMKEIRPIGLALIKKAKQGDISATKELFDRAFGKPFQTPTISPKTQLVANMREAMLRARERYST